MIFNHPQKYEQFNHPEKGEIFFVAFPAPPAPEPRAAHFPQPFLRRAVGGRTARLPLTTKQKICHFLNFSSK